MSRYLVSDAAVCTRVPLVSAASLRTDGQLFVLNHPAFRPEDPEHSCGPCYRCIHPKPPPPESLTSCGEGGVLGPVVGTMGVLMATEALKILVASSSSAQSTGTQASSNIRNGLSGPAANFMLMYSAFASPPFRSIKIRGRRANCVACSSDPALREISPEALQARKIDYATFCGLSNTQDILGADARMEPERLADLLRKQSGEECFLLDTRDRTQFDICHLPGSINIPLEKVKGAVPGIFKVLERDKKKALVAVCRFGNDSQVAANMFRQQLQTQSSDIWIGDLKGGLEAWRTRVDHNFPKY